MSTATENQTRAGAILSPLDELAPYDLSESANLSSKRTGIEGVVIYCGRADEGGKHSPYRIKVSVGKAWGASRKLFTVGTHGKIQGRWFYARGSEYKQESDVPAKILRNVRDFIEHNQALLKEWVEYDGLDDDTELFVPRVRTIN